MALFSAAKLSKVNAHALRCGKSPDFHGPYTGTLSVVLNQSPRENSDSYCKIQFRKQQNRVMDISRGFRRRDEKDLL